MLATTSIGSWILPRTVLKKVDTIISSFLSREYEQEQNASSPFLGTVIGTFQEPVCEAFIAEKTTSISDYSRLQKFPSVSKGRHSLERGNATPHRRAHRPELRSSLHFIQNPDIDTSQHRGHGSEEAQLTQDPPYLLEPVTLTVGGYTTF